VHIIVVACPAGGASAISDAADAVDDLERIADGIRLLGWRFPFHPGLGLNRQIPSQQSSDC